MPPLLQTVRTRMLEEIDFLIIFPYVKVNFLLCFYYIIETAKFNYKRVTIRLQFSYKLLRFGNKKSRLETKAGLSASKYSRRNALGHRSVKHGIAAEKTCYLHRRNGQEVQIFRVHRLPVAA